MSRPPRSSSSDATAFRTRRWQHWRESYLENIPERCRGAWVRSPDDGAACPIRGRMARVLDVGLGGLQLQARHCFESGTLLTVELWGYGTSSPSVLPVRVLNVARSAVNGEWLYHCAFATHFGPAATAC